MDEPVQAHMGETINLGEIKRLISPLSIDAEGLKELGFEHVAKQKAAKLYLKSDLPKIFATLSTRIASAGASLIIAQ